MRDQILEHLRSIEQTHDVRVLFACESGSRGWGFASPDSDYDVRFVYVHRLSWYLSVHPGRDVIELPISGVLDINGWDLRKALGLIQQSNPTLVEWLRSPIQYLAHENTCALLEALAAGHFSATKGWNHYLSMARKNYRGYLKGDEVRFKKYLYVLRPLMAARWIASNAGIPPMRFATLAQHVLSPVTDADLIKDINALLEVKMRASEAATSPPWRGLSAFIDQELGAAVQAPERQPETASVEEIDAFLMAAVLDFEACQQHEQPRTKID
ncbi:MAG: nucleotidyltransferase domain-containing protein [Ideonella sp.]|nr:nucleotidyltransferase domain-containing protein [Ideonella sp.]